MSIKKQFAKYVSQNILGMLGVSCYIIVDTFFISKAAGADGITALNLVLPLYGLIYAIGAMIGVGSATRFTIMRKRGEKEADDYLFNALFWVLLLSIPFVLAGIFVPDKVVALMGGDLQIAALGKAYTRIFLMFTPFFMANHVFMAYVRNDKAPTLAMIATLASSMSNIVFDYIFMFPMGLGLTGAALATVISPILSILICGTHFLMKKNTVRMKIGIPSLRRLGQSCQLGVAAFVGEITSAVTTTVFNFLILGLVGNIGVAAYGIVANFALVATAIFNGIAQGAQPLVSAQYGAGQTQGTRKLLRYGIVVAMSIAVLLVGVVWGFTDELVALFNSEGSGELAGYAYWAIRLYFIGYLLAGFNIVVTGFFSATDRPKEAFVASVLRGVVAIVICAVVMSRLWGIMGIWLAFAASELITALVAGVFLWRQKRRRMAQ